MANDIHESIEGHQAAECMLAKVGNPAQQVLGADWLYEEMRDVLAFNSEARVRAWCRRIAKEIERSRGQS